MDIPEETTADLKRRLRRIEGQVRGVQQMLSDQRDCRDVLTQIAAARKALDQVGFGLVASGVTWCLAHPDDPDAGGASLEEMQRWFTKLA